jgi:hypothetical protein
MIELQYEITRAMSHHTALRRPPGEGPTPTGDDFK